MTFDDQISAEKLQYDINREVAKVSALPSGKIDKYEHLTDEEILPPIKSKQVKASKDLKSEDQKKWIEGIFPKDREGDEIKSELSKVKKRETKVIKDNLLYDSSRKFFGLRIFKSIRSLVIVFITTKLKIHDASLNQADLLEYILDFDNKTRPRSSEDKNKKMMFLILQKTFVTVEN